MAPPGRVPDWAVAAACAAVLVAAGVLSPADARGALGDLGPTVAFLAALLVLADGCLILLPATAAAGPGAVLAMLIGVNVGPNLTFSGSLATLLWRRVMHAHDEPADLGEFTRLGALTVPCVLVASTVMLWLGLQIL